jgi:hypothetical protein
MKKRPAVNFGEEESSSSSSGERKRQAAIKKAEAEARRRALLRAPEPESAPTLKPAEEETGEETERTSSDPGAGGGAGLGVRHGLHVRGGTGTVKGQSAYMENLLKQANERKRIKDAAFERKMAREAGDDGPTEAFVTSAYKEHLASLAEQEKAEEAKDMGGPTAAGMMGLRESLFAAPPVKAETEPLLPPAPAPPRAPAVPKVAERPAPAAAKPAEVVEDPKIRAQREKVEAEERWKQKILQARERFRERCQRATMVENLK